MRYYITNKCAFNDYFGIQTISIVIVLEAIAFLLILEHFRKKRPVHEIESSAIRYNMAFRTNKAARTMRYYRTNKCAFNDYFGIQPMWIVRVLESIAFLPWWWCCFFLKCWVFLFQTREMLIARMIIS